MPKTGTEPLKNYIKEQLTVNNYEVIRISLTLKEFGVLNNKHLQVMMLTCEGNVYVVLQFNNF